MRLLKFAILLCLSMMFATSYAQMAVKETDKRKVAIDVFDDKDFELAVGYNDYVVSQPGKDTGWASYSFCARGKIKELAELCLDACYVVVEGSLVEEVALLRLH